MIKNIENALEFISSDVRDNCVKAGMSIKSELGEIGYSIWDSWLQTGEGYNKIDMLSVWKSIDVSGGVGIGTLFHLAKESGYSPEKSTLSTAEIEQRKLERQAMQEKAEEERKQEQAEVAKQCQSIWGSASPVTEHPYLANKQINSYGLRQCKDSLVVPMYKDKKVVSLQFIQSDGSKTFKKGGGTTGAYFIIGKPGNSFLITESYGTGASVYQATGICTVAAFSCGNLLSVAKTIRKHFPDKTITICADNDQFTNDNPGLKKATEAAKAIDGYIVIPEFKDISDKPSDFNDLHCQESLEIVKQQIMNALDNKPEKKPSEKGNLPTGFSFKKNSLYYSDPDDEAEGDGIWICSKLEVTGKTTSDQNHDWGKVLEFMDSDFKQHKVVIPLELFAGDGAEVRRILLSQGLLIGTSAKSRNLLSQYIQQTYVKRLTRCVSKTGWYKDSFVLPDEVIGSGDDVILQNATGDYSGYGINEDLSMWQENVSKYCVGNSRLALSVSTAFAAPLIPLLNMESGGIHFRGGSSEGKTTALYVASSVWGNEKWMKKWRATDNGIEGVAVVHNNTLLTLDELAEMEPRAVSKVAYMLANGQGKNRADRNGNARKAKTWCLLFISTGEISLAQHIESVGLTVRAGQEIRVLDVPSKTTYGIFENLHGFECGSILSTHLVNNSKSYYGTASRAFLKKLVSNKTYVINYLNTFKSKFIKRLDVENASGQVKRAAMRFAVIAGAGELATEWSITGWPPGEATKSARICFESWKANRGGEQSQENIQALKQVKSFIESHGESRFTSWDVLNGRTVNRVGYSRTIDEETFYYFFPETFKKEVCKGIDYKVVLDVLKEKRALVFESGRLTFQIKPGKTKIRVYAIKWSELVDC